MTIDRAEVDAAAAGLLARQPGLLGRLRGGRIRRRSARSAAQSFTITFIAVIAVAAFLSPLLRSFTVSIKNPDQNSQVDGPLLPSTAESFTYRGRQFNVYKVPFPDGVTRELALVRKGRTSSQFVDPKDAAQALITWQGEWRTLTPVYAFDPQWHNYADVWDQINYPRLLFNTIAIALIGTFGLILSIVQTIYTIKAYNDAMGMALMALNVSLESLALQKLQLNITSL